MKEKINFPMGIFGEPYSITGQKKLRNPRYMGQLRFNKKVFIDYLNSVDGEYLYLTMLKQIKDPKKLTFIVEDQKNKDITT